MRLVDPLELYKYPEDWVKQRAEEEGSAEVRRKVESGLYILTPDGYLRRGITTATTTSAAICGAISGEESVTVSTPSGIDVNVRVQQKGVCIARKFAGDHAFDVTDGMEFVARVSSSGEAEIEFGRGIGEKKGEKAVSRAAMRQILENFRKYADEFDFKGKITVEVPSGEKIAKKTDNEKLGIKGGISILGTTGFVEPWCRKLIDVKAEIASMYDRLVITTGRGGWRWAKENLPGYQPIVFGVHITEGLRAARGKVIIVGKPSLLVKWAIPELRGKKVDVARKEEFYRKAILERARSINEGVEDVILLGGRI
ncbi:cobalt-precorrin-5B (C(1))-methyltransferase [Archaeoglobus veneficus]|uniref:Cobalamin (Vitamin B12) biosynthesis CbiD protein n=1 Tax=Archaeoglobus veneficus (strain DSM 11195 / SNP6) TaxID=693661 RepID=F2KRZ9_ARCVS|nr:cobalt-precorrin-5B (C(1))-methyltransferase [Archaeoglobus veneficus]AEA46840.1 cobalamin (vitamin B12) biosynthesis CbiD protein [Archaeoglobus veneficus SNP6]